MRLPTLFTVAALSLSISSPCFASSTSEYCERLADKALVVNALKNQGGQYPEVIELLNISARPDRDKSNLMSVVKYVYDNHDDNAKLKAVVLSDCYRSIVQDETGRTTKLPGLSMIIM